MHSSGGLPDTHGSPSQKMRALSAPVVPKGAAPTGGPPRNRHASQRLPACCFVYPGCVGEVRFGTSGATAHRHERRRCHLCHVRRGLLFLRQSRGAALAPALHRLCCSRRAAESTDTTLNVQSGTVDCRCVSQLDTYPLGIYPQCSFRIAYFHY